MHALLIGCGPTSVVNLETEMNVEDLLFLIKLFVIVRRAVPFSYALPQDMQASLS